LGIVLRIAQQLRPEQRTDQTVSRRLV